MERKLKPFPMRSVDSTPDTSQQSIDQSDLPHYPLRRQSGRGWLKWLIAAAILLLVVAGGGLLFHALHKTTPKHTSSTSHAVQPSQDHTNQNTTTQYVSNGQDLNLSFSYPSDWSVTPATNDNPTDQTITVTSPLVSIENASNTTITGKVVVMIRPGSATLSELASGNATAGQSSVQIGYTQPLASQQQYPYLSFINLSGGADASGGFQEVIITGQQQFSQGQSIPEDDLSGLDPIISASFYSCSTSECTGSGEAPLSIAMDTWQNTSPFTQVLALMQSLQLH